MMRSVDTYRKLAAAQASRRVLGVLCAALVTLCAVTAHLEWRTQPTSVIARSGPSPSLPYYNVADFPGADAGQKIMACIAAVPDYGAPAVGGICDARLLGGV